MSNATQYADRYADLKDGTTWVNTKGEAVDAADLNFAHAQNVLRILQRVKGFTADSPLSKALYRAAGWNAVRVPVSIPLNLSVDDTNALVVRAITEQADPKVTAVLVSLAQAVASVNGYEAPADDEDADTDE